jgi:hypothetical protein
MPAQGRVSRFMALSEGQDSRVKPAYAGRETASTPAVRSVESAEVENLTFVGDTRATARTAAP